MPQMNSYELVKRISKLQNGIKIILMSAFEINHTEGQGTAKYQDK